MVVTTLDAAYLAFDPAQPLRGPLLRDYYVDREGNPTARMSAILLRNPTAPDKLLFTGHRGCGKSTELNLLLANPRFSRPFWWCSSRLRTSSILSTCVTLTS